MLVIKIGCTVAAISGLWLLTGLFVTRFCNTRAKIAEFHVFLLCIGLTIVFLDVNNRAMIMLRHVSISAAVFLHICFLKNSSKH